MCDTKKSDLLKKISEAFAENVYPGDENLVVAYGEHDLEAIELRDAFLGKHWKGIPVEHLLYHHAALSYFTPAAFRYYLPSYLIAVIDSYEQADIIPEYLIGHLTPRGMPQNSDMEQFVPEPHGITDAQIQAVVDYIESLKNKGVEFFEQSDITPEELKHLLTQTDTPGSGDWERYASMISGFTAAQVNVITSFLRFLREKNEAFFRQCSINQLIQFYERLG